MNTSTQNLQEQFAAAAQGHDFEALMALVARGGSPDSMVAGQPLLVYAVTQGQAALAGRLIDAGANLEGADLEGNTALMHAGRLAMPGMVTALLEYGADALARNHAGRSAQDETHAGRKAFVLTADGEGLTPEDIENSCARFGRAAAILAEAEVEAYKRREILSCHDGLAAEITVKKPIAFKP